MIGSAQYKKEMEGNCMREESETNGKRRKKRNAIQDAFFGTLCFCCLLWSLIFLHPTGLSSKSVMNPICYSEEMPDGEQKAEGLAKEIEEEHNAVIVKSGSNPYSNHQIQAALPEEGQQHYRIPDDALAAPKPKPEGYGSVEVEEAYRMAEIISKARKLGVLESNETIAFDPDCNFYRGVYSGNIEYYLDETILVVLWKEEIDGFCCTFTEVKVKDPSQFRRMLAEDTYGAAAEYPASLLAASANAVVAMNADYYKFRDFGISVYNRDLYRFNTDTYTGKYKKYNCVDTLFIDSNGDFHYKRVLEENSVESIQQFLKENDIIFSLAFGPILVQDGEPVTCSWYPAGEIDKGYSRAGIGQMGERHYLYMSLNHGDKSARWTVNQFAEHFAEKPVITAYCLDGGQTGEVVFRGEPYNHVDFGAERNVSDIIYFATAVPEGERE